jgi:FMN-dependent oxidoreductase (nitrilotriacetate monooxygenase family)
MSSPQRQLHFNAFLMSSGHHEAAWRLPESNPFANTDLGHWRDLAQIAERATFDSLFLADGPAVRANPQYRPASALEPTILLTALAGATSHIGLIATASTTYNAPYNLARRFASLDHVSGGRAGWNIVTTADIASAQNFGLDDRPGHRERYARAAEFVDVSIRLWDSWEDGAELGDKAAGIYADPARIHPVDYEGDYFRVRGPLNVPRSPQGRPLLVQAGSSEDGREFAARYAEAIFTAQQTLADGQEFYADMKRRARRLGRDPAQIKILPGIVPVIGSTEAEAHALSDELEELITPAYGLDQLAKLLEVPPGILELDRPLPAEVFGRPLVEGAQSRAELITGLARREDLTVRELIGRLGGGRGHRTFTGTPEQVADTIQDWFDRGAADGFNVMPAALPSGLRAFADHVIPIFRRRGLFRTEYTGQTLRDHYGLSRPASQFTATCPRGVPEPVA